MEVLWTVPQKAGARQRPEIRISAPREVGAQRGERKK